MNKKTLMIIAAVVIGYYSYTIYSGASTPAT